MILFQKITQPKSAKRMIVILNGKAYRPERFTFDVVRDPSYPVNGGDYGRRSIEIRQYGHVIRTQTSIVGQRYGTRPSGRKVFYLGALVDMIVDEYKGEVTISQIQPPKVS